MTIWLGTKGAPGGPSIRCRRRATARTAVSDPKSRVVTLDDPCSFFRAPKWDNCTRQRGTLEKCLHCVHATVADPRAALGRRYWPRLAHSCRGIASPNRKTAGYDRFRSHLKTARPLVGRMHAVQEPPLRPRNAPRVRSRRRFKIMPRGRKRRKRAPGPPNATVRPERSAPRVPPGPSWAGGRGPCSPPAVMASARPQGGPGHRTVPTVDGGSWGNPHPGMPIVAARLAGATQWRPFLGPRGGARVQEAWALGPTGPASLGIRSCDPPPPLPPTVGSGGRGRG